jgi:release factor glutamine methyltransferase
MKTTEPDVPLVIRLELTTEQQRRIREQTGHSVTVIPIESKAPSVRCRFGGVELVVSRGVFVPTQSSERTFEFAKAMVAGVSTSSLTGPIVVDVGTGAGAIALAMASAMPQAIVYGTEVSPLALAAARRNRARLGLRNARFACGSLLSPLPKRLRVSVDLIVANIPYLPPSQSAEISRLFPGGTAMGAEPDGLGLVRELLRRSRAFLRARGALVLQLADFQWPTIAIEATTLGFAAPLFAAREGLGPIAGCLVWPGEATTASSPPDHA